MIALVLLGCMAPVEHDAPEPESEVPCDDTDDTRVLVVRKMTFGRRVDGVSPGFDLDGHVSDDDDAEGCYQEDLVDPNGVEGIDNQFSALIPVLEATEGAGLEGLVQDVIDAGSLLVLFELEDVDSDTSDTCINVNVVQGLGTPSLGTDGYLLSGQTFDRDPSVEESRAEHVAIVDGTLVATGLELALPIQVFDVQVDLLLHDVALSLTLDALGGATGHVAGGFDVQQVIDILEPRTDIAIKDLAIDLLRSYADLFPDETGACPQFSLVLEIEATSAFLFDD